MYGVDKSGYKMVKKHGYRGGFGVVLQQNVAIWLMGGIKVGNGHVWGGWIYGVFCEYCSAFSFFGGERSIPHHQCREQERTTCSGGYPSATCSAFLHYCDGA